MQVAHATSVAGLLLQQPEISHLTTRRRARGIRRYSVADLLARELFQMKLQLPLNVSLDSVTAKQRPQTQPKDSPESHGCLIQTAARSKVPLPPPDEPGATPPR